MKGLERKVLELAQRNGRLEPMKHFGSFCGVCVYLTMVLPLARFYTRSLYFDMSMAGRGDGKDPGGEEGKKRGGGKREGFRVVSP